MSEPGVSPTLLVDLYELTMAAAYLSEGMAERPATFSLFVRKLPPKRGYLVAAGLEDALAYLETVSFCDDDLEALAGLDMFDQEFLDYLAGLRFTGSVRAMPEGTIVFADEPILEVDAPMAQAQLAETFLLNQITAHTTLASKAARFRHAARDRVVVDFALRRAQGVDAGMKLARAARICGLGGTSNVAGAVRYGLRPSGTMAHSFIQAYPDESEAFRTFARHLGDQTVLLVDTYDSHRGIDRAVQVAREFEGEGIKLRGIRLDSGDFAELAREARGRLDEAHLPEMQILASGGLDEHDVERLVGEEVPIDGFGVGSELGVSTDAPVLDSVYKLVAYDGRPVRKQSTAKATLPGPKQVWRVQDWSGDLLGRPDEEVPLGTDALLVEVMRDGQRTELGRATASDASDRFEQQWQELPKRYKHLRDPASYPVRLTPGLERLTRQSTLS